MDEERNEIANKFIEIDFLEIAKVLWARKLIIIIIILIGAIMGYAYASFVQVPVYKASTTLYVFNENSRNSGTVNLSDVNLSKTLIDSYIVIMQSDLVLKQVAEEMGGSYTAESLRDEVTASSVDETEVFKIVVSDLDPVNSAQIANIMARVLKSEIVRIVHAGSVEVIDEAAVPKVPTYGIGVLSAVIGGAFLALIFICLFFAVLTVLDTRIKSQDQLTRIFDYPLLGAIPALLMSKNIQDIINSPRVKTSKSKD